MVSRVERGPVADWFWTIDRLFLAAFIGLMGIGLMLSFAASPAVAERLGLDSFHFVTRHGIFLLPALAVMMDGGQASFRVVGVGSLANNRLYRANGTLAARTDIASGDVIGDYNVWGQIEGNFTELSRIRTSYVGASPGATSFTPGPSTSSGSCASGGNSIRISSSARSTTAT